MKRQARLVPVFVSFLLVLGFGLHLANLGQYLQFGHARLENIVTPGMDTVLAGWMTYCAVLLIFGARQVFAHYEVRGWRRAVYWVVTGYVTLSLPGHYRYLATHDITYFQFFPWWFSPVIMTVYVLFIAFLLSLRPREAQAGVAAVA